MLQIFDNHIISYVIRLLGRSREYAAIQCLGQTCKRVHSYCSVEIKRVVDGFSSGSINIRDTYPPWLVGLDSFKRYICEGYIYHCGLINTMIKNKCYKMLKAYVEPNLILKYAILSDDMVALRLALDIGARKFYWAAKYGHKTGYIEKVREIISEYYLLGELKCEEWAYKHEVYTPLTATYKDLYEFDQLMSTMEGRVDVWWIKTFGPKNDKEKLVEKFARKFVNEKEGLGSSQDIIMSRACRLGCMHIFARLASSDYAGSKSSVTGSCIRHRRYEMFRLLVERGVHVGRSEIEDMIAMEEVAVYKKIMEECGRTLNFSDPISYLGDFRYDDRRFIRRYDTVLCGAIRAFDWNLFGKVFGPAGFYYRRGAIEHIDTALYAHNFRAFELVRRAHKFMTGKRFFLDHESYYRDLPTRFTKLCCDYIAEEDKDDDETVIILEGYDPSAYRSEAE